MKRAEETKHAQPLQNLAGTPLLAYGSAGLTNTSTFIELTTVFNTIGQGVGQGDRIGNRISPVKFVFSGFMNFNADTPSAAGNLGPQYVKMFIFRMKNSLSALSPDMSKFFQYGSTTQPPTGYIQDIRNRVNTDDVVLYATRTFKLAPSALQSGITTIATADTNNDFKLTQSFKVDLTKYVRKVVYDDTTAQIKNHQMFAAFVFGLNNCTKYEAYTDDIYHSPIQIAYNIECSYKDD